MVGVQLTLPLRGAFREAMKPRWGDGWCQTGHFNRAQTRYEAVEFGLDKSKPFRIILMILYTSGMCIFQPRWGSTRTWDTDLFLVARFNTKPSNE